MLLASFSQIFPCLWRPMSYLLGRNLIHEFIYNGSHWNDIGAEL